VLLLMGARDPGLESFATQVMTELWFFGVYNF
jgi:hypothetical protein